MNMMSKYANLKVMIAASLPLGLLLAGCPTGGTIDPKIEYDAGFVVGFAEDGEYWQGFDDSYDTVDGGEIYYTGDLIRGTSASATRLMARPDSPARPVRPIRWIYTSGSRGNS